MITSYLLSITGSQPSQNIPPEAIIQAASSLIDIFADETMPYDTNFRQGGFLAQLSNTGLDCVRRAVRAVNRKNEGGRELRERGEETLENLRNFIKYRRNLRQ
jgi:hypothetical protein